MGSGCFIPGGGMKDAYGVFTSSTFAAAVVSNVSSGTVAMSHPSSLVRSPVDFVGHDVAALASHMQHCAQARGRWFATRHHLQQVRSMAAGRIVTIACVAAMIGIGVLSVA